MTITNNNWLEFEVVGPVETQKYRTNADASLVQFWSDNKVPGIAKIGWNTTKFLNASTRAKNALKAAQALGTVE